MNVSQIDFAPPSLRLFVHRIPRSIWVVGTIGITLGIAAIGMVYELHQQQYNQRQEIEQIQRKSQLQRPVQSTLLPAQIGAAQVEAVNSIVDRLNIPWSHVFTAIESATPANIVLLELTPDQKRNAVKGTAEGKTMQEILEYLARLGAQSFFEHVVLVHHEINEQDQNKPVRFQFIAAWEGPEK